jgi:hypothetical protein
VAWLFTSTWTVISFVSAIALVEVALDFFSNENFVRISLRMEAFYIVHYASSNAIGGCGAGGKTRQNYKKISDRKICQKNKNAGP